MILYLRVALTFAFKQFFLLHFVTLGFLKNNPSGKLKAMVAFVFGEERFVNVVVQMPGGSPRSNFPETAAD